MIVAMGESDLISYLCSLLRFSFGSDVLLLQLAMRNESASTLGGTDPRALLTARQQKYLAVLKQQYLTTAVTYRGAFALSLILLVPLQAPHTSSIPFMWHEKRRTKCTH